MLRPRLFALLLGAVPCAALGTLVAAFDARPASASTAIALSLDDLVDKSELVVVATATSKTSKWEGGKIMTYTTLTVDAPVAGKALKNDVIVVRTLGGVVGDVGQKVYGEAVLNVGAQQMLFLRPLTTTSARSVVGMEQGVFPVVVDAQKKAIIGPLPTTLNLVPPAGAKGIPAREATQGRALNDVVSDVKALWIAHAKK